MICVVVVVVKNASLSSNNETESYNPHKSTQNDGCVSHLSQNVGKMQDTPRGYFLLGQNW